MFRIACETVQGWFSPPMMHTGNWLSSLLGKDPWWSFPVFLSSHRDMVPCVFDKAQPLSSKVSPSLIAALLIAPQFLVVRVAVLEQVQQMIGIRKDLVLVLRILQSSRLKAVCIFQQDQTGFSREVSLVGRILLATRLVLTVLCHSAFPFVFPPMPVSLYFCFRRLSHLYYEWHCASHSLPRSQRHSPSCLSQRLDFIIYTSVCSYCAYTLCVLWCLRILPL